MALYTRGGDDGSTGLPVRAGSSRVRKDAPAPEALGAVDELNAAVGLCLSEATRIDHMAIRDALGQVQPHLLCAGSVLAATGGGIAPPVSLSPEAVGKMEKDIDAVWADLPELTAFVLPGGCELGARLHVARVAARRAERAVVALVGPGGREVPAEARPAVRQVMAYLNRLSDLLFALARLANRDSGEGDAVWTPGA